MSVRRRCSICGGGRNTGRRRAAGIAAGGEGMSGWRGAQSVGADGIPVGVAPGIAAGEKECRVGGCAQSVEVDGIPVGVAPPGMADGGYGMSVRRRCSICGADGIPVGGAQPGIAADGEECRVGGCAQSVGADGIPVGVAPGIAADGEGMSGRRRCLICGSGRNTGWRRAAGIAADGEGMSGRRRCSICGSGRNTGRRRPGNRFGRRKNVGSSAAGCGYGRGLRPKGGCV